jgi:multidrug efflux pump subunit AcrA (membrane-fusion protein)
VDYIDPRVDPQTRTAKARVVVENRDLMLRLGMYADVHFAHSGTRAAVVPPQAVQVVGTSTVVYTPIDGQPGQFRQVAVTAGSLTTTERQIVSGIQPGQQVVTEGSFLLRAEAIRQNAR